MPQMPHIRGQRPQRASDVFALARRRQRTLLLRASSSSRTRCSRIACRCAITFDWSDRRDIAAEKCSSRSRTKASGDEEQRVRRRRRCPSPRRAARSASCQTASPRMTTRAEQPQQRVALHQAPAAHQLEHDDQQGHRASDGDDLDPALHQMPCSAATGAGIARLGDGTHARQPDEEGQQHLDHVVDGLAGPDRRHAAVAQEHPHRHLGHLQPVVVDHQHRLDLGVVVRVVAREQRDRAVVVEPEARRRVAHPLAHDPREDEGEDVDAGAAADRRRIAVVLGQEARAAHHVDRAVGSPSRASAGGSRAGRAGRRRRPGPCGRSRARARRRSRPARRRRCRGCTAAAGRARRPPRRGAACRRSTRRRPRGCRSRTRARAAPG